MPSAWRRLLLLSCAAFGFPGSVASCFAQGAQAGLELLSPEAEARITEIVRNAAALGPEQQQVIAGRQVAPLSYREVMRLGLNRNLNVQFQKQALVQADAGILGARAAFDPIATMATSYSRFVSRERIEAITRLRKQEPDFDAFQKKFERAKQSGEPLPTQQQLVSCSVKVDGVQQPAPGGALCTPTVTTLLEAASFRGLRPDESYAFVAQGSKRLEYGGFFSFAFQSSFHPRQSPFVTVSATDFAFVPQHLAYTSTLALGFDTPLPFGKNFGPFGTQQITDLQLARTRREGADHEYASVTENTLLAVDNAYWDLVGSLMVLQVTLEQKAIVEQLRRRAQRSFELREITEYAMNQIDARLASTLAREALAWNGLASASETLQNLLNGEILQLLLPVAYRQPLEQAPAVDLDAARRNAMERNPEVRRSEILLEESRIALNHRLSDVKPDVFLSASVNFGQSNQVVGYPSLSDSLLKLFNPDVRNLAIGVTLRIPIGNAAAKAALGQARVTVMQARDQLSQSQSRAIVQLTTAIDALQSAQKQIEISRVNMKLAEDAFAAAGRRRALNLASEFDVLEIQGDLLQAKLSHVDALVQYRKNVARFLASQNLLAASAID
jgi:outer membrane protein TolC